MNQRRGIAQLIREILWLSCHAGINPFQSTASSSITPGETISRSVVGAMLKCRRNPRPCVQNGRFRMTRSTTILLSAGSSSGSADFQWAVVVTLRGAFKRIVHLADSCVNAWVAFVSPGASGFPPSRSSSQITLFKRVRKTGRCKGPFHSKRSTFPSPGLL